ncbi:MAG TPA: patatin-like phospholipase family protein [Candidatus Dormibacteraeota bacterium]|nr:patatin-like phospholipase family protein [Candidatus Dormibacteraeota bacterium]
MKIGLVLGGGGVRGASWMMGALHGLAAETGWDPGTADVVVGTSAGAVVAALTLAGARPWEALAPEREEFLRALLDGAAFDPRPTVRSLWPGSPPLVATALRRGPSYAMHVVAGVLPEGLFSTEPIARLIRDRAPLGWPAGQRLWIVATDYTSGERVAFGRPAAPDAELPAAVAASCAIPAFYRPVRIGGRRYVDGGVHTGANLDLVAGEQLDLVICLNPLSSRPGTASGVYWPVRTLLHQQLRPQMRAVERGGAQLVVLEPDGRSIDLIGLNPMSRHRVEEVGVAAALEVQEYVQHPSVSRKLAGLPLGPQDGGRMALSG